MEEAIELDDYDEFQKVQSEKFDTVVLNSTLHELKTGSLITVHGKTHKNCIRFTVDLLSVQQGGIIPFRVHPRLDRSCIIRNSYTMYGWGEEEATSLSKFSIRLQTPFNIEIFCAESEFLVSVNNIHFCKFQYRTPLRFIDSVLIRGPVDIDYFGVRAAKIYPTVSAKKLESSKIESTSELINSKPIDMPYTAVLENKLNYGTQFEIYGKVKLLPHKFNINLQDGPQIWPKPNILLNLNYIFQGETNVFLKRSRRQGLWQDEEQRYNFPLSPGYPFAMYLRILSNCYSVWINGKLIGEFNYRDPNEILKINTICLQGDVNIYYVKQNENIVEDIKTLSVFGYKPVISL